jgi:hypothetical protein
VAELSCQCVTFVSIYVFGLLFTRPGVQPRHATEASTYPSKPVIPMHENGQREHQNRSNVNTHHRKVRLPKGGSFSPFGMQDRIMQRSQMVEILLFHHGGMRSGIVAIFPAAPPAAPGRFPRPALGQVHLPGNCHVECHFYAPSISIDTKLHGMCHLCKKDRDPLQTAAPLNNPRDCNVPACTLKKEIGPF